MALTVSTLANVPEGEGFIVEVGLEDHPTHPANDLDRDRIRDELEDPEWYVRTAEQAEEQKLVLEVDDFDHSRFPALVVLTAHPTKASEGTAIYLDNVESEEEAWWVLQRAMFELRTGVTENRNDDYIAKRIKQTIASSERPFHITASAVALIEFGADALG
jgi:hypothetical protein